MNVTTTAALAALALTFAACGDVGDAPRAEVSDTAGATAGQQSPAGDGTTLPIDTARSSVSWKAAKVTRAHDGGFRNFSGDVTLNGTEVAGVRVSIDAGSIYADDEKLTGHLRSNDFFGVDSFPTATFVADRFEKRDSAGATHMVSGDLTIRDATKRLTFPATINVNGNEVTARADFIINRKNWNIIYPGAPDDLISDDVRVIFDVVAKR